MSQANAPAQAETSGIENKRGKRGRGRGGRGRGQQNETQSPDPAQATAYDNASMPPGTISCLHEDKECLNAMLSRAKVDGTIPLPDAECKYNATLLATANRPMSGTEAQKVQYATR